MRIDYGADQLTFTGQAIWVESGLPAQVVAEETVYFQESTVSLNSLNKKFKTIFMGIIQMNRVTKIAAFIGSALITTGAHAADWNITQTANITVPEPIMTQGGTANVVSSTQALNGIALDTLNDDLATGTQTANIAASTGVQMTQGPSVDDSVQATNFIAGRDIGSTDVISQVVNQTEVSTTSVTQTDTSGAGLNAQAVNYSDASGDVDRLLQDYNESGSISMTQENISTSLNAQAINAAVAEGNTATVSLTQSIDVDGVATLTQAASSVGGSNAQGGNVAVALGGQLDNTIQSFTATTTDLNVTQEAASDINIQGANIIATGNIVTAGGGGNIGDTAGSTSQTLTIAAGGANFSQAVSGSDNVQAGNLASSDGDISDLTQTFEATNALEVDFDQTPTAANNTQAGNMAILQSGTGDVIDEISQVFNSSLSSTDFNQNSGSSNLTQAGNYIDITTGNIDDSDTTQLFTALGGAVAMTQSGAGTASGNLQALNGIVDAAGAGTGGTVSQVLTITAASYTMTQDNITGSGQFGNFVGVKF